MMEVIVRERLTSDLQKLGIVPGDVVLVRAALKEVGRLVPGVEEFVEALIDAVGCEGTIVSLSFTDSSFVKMPNKSDAFHLNKKSYAGALPNSMLSRHDAIRSRHPTCSYVAIGKYAEYITADHDEQSPAYAPVQKIVELGGKCLLVGCVESSPGFTTAHLAEYNLGYLKKLPVFPWLNRTYYYSRNGDIKLFSRKDPGLCSSSFYKFYALYVKKSILRAGYVGRAYSIIAPAQESYAIELDTLRKNSKFNICGSKDCWTCNIGRWDRIHHAPTFLLRRLMRYLQKRRN